MLGSKNRDYKTDSRRIKNNLARHKTLMDSYEAKGMAHEEASRKAYDKMNEVTP